MFGSIAKAVREHSKIVISIILILTLLFTYFASQEEMSNDYSEFMPDNDVAQAYKEIMGNYYSSEMVSIIARYNGEDALSREALIQELQLKKRLIEDGEISSFFKDSEHPSKNILTVADIVVAMDIVSKSTIGMMNATVYLLLPLKLLNGTVNEINRSVAGYIANYEIDPESNETSRYLNKSYYLIKLFLAAENIVEIPHLPGTLPNMSVDEEISYLKNMSDGEIKNIVMYGTAYSPAVMKNIKYKFNRSAGQVMNISESVSLTSREISKNLGVSLNTTPVSSNDTLSETFTDAKNEFESLEQHFNKLYNFTQTALSMANSNASSFFAGILRTLISKDLNTTTGTAEATIIIVALNGTAGSEDPKGIMNAHEKIRSIAESFNGNGEYMVISGRLVGDEMQGSVDEIFNIILPLAFVIVVVILLAIFRSIIDTLLGLLGLFMAIIWAYGIGAMMGLGFNIVTTTVAILIVGLGIDYAIHTITRYREELNTGKSVRDAVESMELHLGLPLILATATTMLSFLSNLSSPVPALRSYGIMNALGILSALIIFITFIPALKILIDEKRVKEGKSLKTEKKNEKKSFVSAGAKMATRHPKKVITVVIAISILSLYGAANLGTNFSAVDFLPEDSDSYRMITYLMDNFQAGGMSAGYILVKGNITSPLLLKAIDATVKNMADDRYISPIGGENVVYLIRSTVASDANFSALVSSLDTDGDGLPDSDIKEVYDYLYKHVSGAVYVLDREGDEYISTLISFKTSSTSNEEHRVLYDELKEDVLPLEEDGFVAVITGDAVMTYTITSSLQSSQWNSLLLTIVVTLLILVAVFVYLKKSVMLGILTTLPVIIALIWTMGLMFVAGIDFNVMTVTITSLTIGLGITYSIHLSDRFIDEIETGDVEEAIEKTVEGTGGAIMGAAATTIGGFGVLLLSSMPPMKDFGLLTTISIFLSFAISVLVLPSFLVLWARKRKSD